jgi:integrase
MPKRDTENVKTRVEHIVASMIAGHSLDGETSRWIANLDRKLSEKLAAVGLIAQREVETLEPFLTSYVAKRTDAKPATITVYGHTKRCLIEFFGAEKHLRDITLGDADDWRVWLAANQKLSEATIRRRCGIAKQFFRAAIKRRLLTDNPFTELKSGSQANDSRDYFLTRQDAAKIVMACPDAEWRLLFTLSRYGGLRCPSEHLALRWADVDWDNSRILVRSPKTEHHHGGPAGRSRCSRSCDPSSKQSEQRLPPVPPL